MRSRGVEREVVSRVTDPYRVGVMIAPTASRSVLGTGNDMAVQLTYHVADALDSRRPPDLEAIEQQLNRTPIMPMKGANPAAMLLDTDCLSISGGADPAAARRLAAAGF